MIPRQEFAALSAPGAMRAGGTRDAKWQIAGSMLGASATVAAATFGLGPQVGRILSSGLPPAAAGIVHGLLELVAGSGAAISGICAVGAAWCAWPALSAAAARAGLASRSARAARKAARNNAGRYVGPEDLEPWCRAELRGVQDLVDNVIGSLAHPGLHDITRLREEEYAIACRLKDLTDFRREAGLDQTGEDRPAVQEMRQAIRDSITGLRNLAGEYRAYDADWTGAAQEAVPARDETPELDLRSRAEAARNRAAAMNAQAAGLRAFPGGPAAAAASAARGAGATTSATTRETRGYSPSVRSPSSGRGPRPG